MTDFTSALGSLPFLRHALAAGLVTAIAAGVVGSLVVTRRMASAAGGLAHAVLGGVGLAYWLAQAQGVAWAHPLHGAVVVGVGCALLLAWVEARRHERADTAIAALWAVGMAAGVLFLARTPGYRSDLMGYLLGNVLLVDPATLRWLIGLDAVVVLVVWLFREPIIATSFDPEFARLRGVNVDLWSGIVLVLVALTVVSLVYVVGIVMVIALLTLPAAAAGHLTRRVGAMMLVAVVVCAVASTGGLVLSWHWDLPTGAVTVIVAAAIYLLARVGSGLWHRRRPAGSA
ncbi:metal ABC transporter permease [bacterium]|nr:metal ABC transporter permease [bacterium]